MRPICYDLYCGLGGWTEAFLAEGYECIGFDIEAHDYGTGGYPGKLILRDVRSIHGSELADATIIVGSSPCQEFSYRAMPWKRAKALPPPYLGMELFNAQFRIQREASEAAGRHIPMIVENVRGAQKWVGRAVWNYGSFYLWGDVPALMPMAKSIKNAEGSWFAIGSPGQKVVGQNPDGRKLPGNNGARLWSEREIKRLRDVPVKGMGIGSVSWHQGEGQRSPNDPRNFYSTSPKRKLASAMIAKIPYPLAHHIAITFKPEMRATA